MTDEGMPIAYPLLEAGVPVLARGGATAGTVHHVVAAQQQAIFHGLVISNRRLGRRFVPAEDVAAMHERGVDLRIGMDAVADLPVPGDSAAVHDEHGAASSWDDWMRRLTGGQTGRGPIG
jgi:hypothetical protein